MAHRFFYPLCGAILGLSSPFVWLIWCAFSAKKEWWIKWIHTEWSNNSTSYLVIGFVGVALFSLIGYLLAERKSAELDEAESIKDANQQLEELASTDGLTGLFNARYMRERLQVEMANAHRGWLTCLLVDIDHFKKINDQMGHPFGDAVLVHAADLMQSAVRRMDVVGRLGGEEFLVILPEASAERGKEVAERLRLAFEKGTFSDDGKTRPVTVSVGVASKAPNQSIDAVALLKAADEALYAAKKAGRNRVELWESLG